MTRELLPESHALLSAAWRAGAKAGPEAAFEAVKLVACERVLLGDESTTVVAFDRGEAVVMMTVVRWFTAGHFVGLGQAWTCRGVTKPWRLPTFDGDRGIELRMRRELEKSVFAMTGWRLP